MSDLQLTSLQWIEFISALLGLIGVWLNARPHIAGWPIGIVSVLLAALVYFESQLFAEFGLQLFYTISGFYGWWKWQREKNNIHHLNIYRIPRNELWISLIIGSLFTFVIGYFLATYTSADFPWIDSTLAAFSLVAQVWLAKKYLENWLLWIAIDFISMGLYFQKGLWFFMGYFGLLLGLAIWGIVHWKSKEKINSSRPTFSHNS